MSEVTFYSGDINPCPYCTLKHLTDAEAHAGFDEKIKQVIQNLRNELSKSINIDLKSYDEIRKHEHILEDYLTVLRDARKKLEPHRGCSGAISGNPAEYNPDENPAELPPVCIWRKEERKPKEYFHPESFRTLCPECPMARCSLCPPELACASRIIIGCRRKAWDPEAKKCRESTEIHVIYHGSPKPVLDSFKL